MHEKTYHRQLLEEAIRSILPSINGALWLDLGCGKYFRYQKLISRPQREYVALDIVLPINAKNKNFVRGDAHNLPFRNDSFDCIFLIEVLEHLERPFEAIKEVGRVTKKGGTLILSAPFLYPIYHDEFWRFTPDGIKLLLTKAGMSIIKMIMIGGFFTNFAQLQYNLFKRFSSKLPFLNSFKSIVYKLGWFLTRLDSKTRMLSPSGILIIAIKS
ncbi:MAG: class I SAM-dependent methyltransferase [Nitrososphaerota archaeon]|nr:class I SAM-dependent methyltransferase [Nitrososphaerota archaeon]